MGDGFEPSRGDGKRAASLGLFLASGTSGERARQRRDGRGWVREKKRNGAGRVRAAPSTSFFPGTSWQKTSKQKKKRGPA